MKHKFFLTGLIIFACFFNTARIYSEESESWQDITIEQPPAPLIIYELPSFSFATADEEPHFARITVSLAYEENPGLKKELVSDKNAIQHIVSILLHGKKYEDLDSAEDMIELSEEIKAHVNMKLVTGKIREVYFRDYILN